MPEPSSDSLSVTPGVTTGNGQKAEDARKNMDLRGPTRSSLDNLNDNLGGFGAPSVELVGLKTQTHPGNSKVKD